MGKMEKWLQGKLYGKYTMILKHNFLSYFLFFYVVENLIRSKNHKHCYLFIYSNKILVLQTF